MVQCKEIYEPSLNPELGGNAIVLSYSHFKLCHQLFVTMGSMNWSPTSQVLPETYSQSSDKAGLWRMDQNQIDKLYTS